MYTFVLLLAVSLNWVTTAYALQLIFFSFLDKLFDSCDKDCTSVRDRNHYQTWKLIDNFIGLLLLYSH